MKKKAIILIGILLISSIFMISAGANYSQTISQNPCPGGPDQNYANDTFFVFTNVPTRPTGAGTLTIKVRGDYCCYGGPGSYSEAIGVVVEGTSLGAWLPGEDCSYSLITKTFTVTQEQLREWAADGKIEVTLVQGAPLYPEDEGTYSDVNCFCASGYYNYEGGCPAAECGNINIVTLEYEGTAKKSLPMNWIMKKFGLGNKE
ncbi:MAG: hypothetical protein APG12_00545 [Candidatus Methanofastidiosum methylothiophilum]|uniref:Uncharacterized protein n=1 Tax=Candidatus Methanofastidiosum methylothiophilum TaxID=1705564 RepID=A0A150ITB3_9EURY|nr:MAG: hypothetical protein APG11_00564 [Candidatus Methanofastidiosum methylthiophilus]KYC50858.1 MAG: hypothetical protein APG12_00545 [Candidatus Methanofastidiosum methylthiophilus]